MVARINGGCELVDSSLYLPSACNANRNGSRLISLISYQGLSMDYFVHLGFQKSSLPKPIYTPNAHSHFQLLK